MSLISQYRAENLAEARGPVFVCCFILDDRTLARTFDDSKVHVRTASSFFVDFL